METWIENLNNLVIALKQVKTQSLSVLLSWGLPYRKVP